MKFNFLCIIFFKIVFLFGLKGVILGKKLQKKENGNHLMMQKSRKNKRKFCATKKKKVKKEIDFEQFESESNVIKNILKDDDTKCNAKLLQKTIFRKIIPQFLGDDSNTSYEYDDNQKDDEEDESYDEEKEEEEDYDEEKEESQSDEIEDELTEDEETEYTEDLSSDKYDEDKNGDAAEFTNAIETDNDNSEYYSDKRNNEEGEIIESEVYQSDEEQEQQPFSFRKDVLELEEVNYNEQSASEQKYSADKQCSVDENSSHDVIKSTNRYYILDDPSKHSESISGELIDFKEKDKQFESVKDESYNIKNSFFEEDNEVGQKTDFYESNDFINELKDDEEIEYKRKNTHVNNSYINKYSDENDFQIDPTANIIEENCESIDLDRKDESTINDINEITNTLPESLKKTNMIGENKSTNGDYERINNTNIANNKKKKRKSSRSRKKKNKKSMAINQYQDKKENLNEHNTTLSQNESKNSQDFEIINNDEISNFGNLNNNISGDLQKSEFKVNLNTYNKNNVTKNEIDKENNIFESMKLEDILRENKGENAHIFTGFGKKNSQYKCANRNKITCKKQKPRVSNKMKNKICKKIEKHRTREPITDIFDMDFSEEFDFSSEEFLNQTSESCSYDDIEQNYDDANYRRGQDFDGIINTFNNEIQTPDADLIIDKFSTMYDGIEGLVHSKLNDAARILKKGMFILEKQISNAVLSFDKSIEANIQIMSTDYTSKIMSHFSNAFSPSVLKVNDDRRMQFNHLRQYVKYILDTANKKTLRILKTNDEEIESVLLNLEKVNRDILKDMEKDLRSAKNNGYNPKKSKRMDCLRLINKIILNTKRRKLSKIEDIYKYVRENFTTFKDVKLRNDKNFNIKRNIVLSNCNDETEKYICRIKDLLDDSADALICDINKSVNNHRNNACDYLHSNASIKENPKIYRYECVRKPNPKCIF